MQRDAAQAAVHAVAALDDPAADARRLQHLLARDPVAVDEADPHAAPLARSRAEGLDGGAVPPAARHAVIRAAQAGQRVSRAEARPGDIVSFDDGSGVYHNGLYAGGNMLWDSPRAGKSVSKREIWTSSVFFTRVG